MASASFKTPCPSCEAGVLVKDASMIGKKIDCPKCKYRFVVEAPGGSEKASPASKAPPAGAKAKAAPPAKSAKTKPTAKQPPPDEEKADEKSKKKKKGAPNKMVLGLALGGVGLIVLVIGFFVLFGKKGETPRKSPGGTPRQEARGGDPEPNQTPIPGKKNPQKEKPSQESPVVAQETGGPALTNLLPAQSQYVLHLFLKDAPDAIPWLVEAAFQPGALDDETIKKRLGFSLKSVDDVLRAENYTAPWGFTLVHLKEPADPQAVKAALGLQEAMGSPVNGKDFYQVTKNRAWMEQLGKMSLGPMPSSPAGAGKGEDPPIFVRFHDPQTLVFADAAPMKEYLGLGSPPADETYATLKNAGLKNMLTRMEKTTLETGDKVLAASAVDLTQAHKPMASGRAQWHFRPVWDVAYGLDNPQRLRVLGAVLLRKGASDPARFRYQNAVDCASDADARAVEKELHDKVGPQVAHLLGILLGLKVEMADADSGDQPTNPMTTPTPTPSPQVARRPPPGSVPGGRSRVAPPGGRSRPARGPGGPGGGAPPRHAAPPPPPTVQVAKDQVKVNDNMSHIQVGNTDNTAVFTLHLVLDGSALQRLASLAELLMLGTRGQLDAASAGMYRRDLARAEKLLGEQGVKSHVAAGRYPPGLFPRKGGASPGAEDPSLRISWMAGLLPYLGHDALFERIAFDRAWKDPGNWMAAGILVPEFLDLSYPTWTRFAHYPGIPFPLGGTHFVGIAGIGQDAPDYSADDPAVADKLGAFGYDRGVTLDEIKKNRGLSNTAVMIQVPYNGLAGVTPWMAGGGSTLRGIPETDSIKPFISTSKDGKGGTYVLMADGSVRFVTADVKDEVLKALCTIKGPADHAGLEGAAPVTRNASGQN